MPTVDGAVERTLRRILRESSQNGGAPAGFMQDIEAFIAAINWSETFIIGIIVFHLLFMVVAILTRKNNTIQLGLLTMARQSLPIDINKLIAIVSEM